MRGSLLTLTVLTGGSTAFAATWHVNPDGSGDAATIQQAISLAADGDVVELGDGTFTGLGNYDVDFLGKALVVRSANDNPSGCVVDVQGSPTIPRRGFIFQHGEGPDSVLRGVTVTGGCLVGDSPPNAGGAAYCVGSSSPVFQNCLFVANSASLGGAIFSENGAAPAFSDCTFSSNAAVDLAHSGVRGFGGAAYLRTSAAMPASTYLLRCRFTANTSEHNGSALIVSGVHASIADCLFENNVGGDDAAVYLADRSTILTEISNSSFVHNAGGVALGCFRMDVDLISCTFAWNSGGFGGGGVSLYGCNANVVECIFEGNTARRGAGIHVTGGTTALVHDCVLTQNRATGTGASNDGGGGAHVDFASHGSFLNCTFSGNTASLKGGALYDGHRSDMTNCTLVENSAPAGGGVYYSSFASTSALSHSILAFGPMGSGVMCEGSTPTIVCSDLFGNAGGDALCGADGGGNVSADPLFCSRQKGDYHLQWGSPCLPANSLGCDLVGAFGFSGCSSVAVEWETWAGVKARYR